MAKSALTLAATSLLLLSTANAESMYGKSSPVLQLDGTSYQSLIAKSNYTSIIEFYAPWCGHCKNLKPAYEKAAKSLTGLAKVAAVNCDEEHNKPFCGKMGVQGFPTLKIVKPGKKSGKPIVEDYQGARSAKAIVDAVIDKIPNHVKRLKDSDYSDWLEENDKPKAILFSDKGSVSALLKSVAIDFLGSVEVAQIRDKEQEAVEVFGVSKFPTLVLLPGDEKDPVTYDGEMKKSPILEFLSQAAKPNQDPAPKDKKSKPNNTNKSKESKASASFAKASASDVSKKGASAKASQTSETLEDDSNPTESPNPQVPTDNKPIDLPVVEAIPTLAESLPLQQNCLNTKSGTCILALTSSNEEDDSAAVPSLSEIHHKHSQAKRNLFPFYQLPSTNPSAATLREKLGLSKDAVQIIAVNGKRGWYRIYPQTDFSVKALDDWIDAIRMGDLSKEKLPSDGVLVEADTLPTEQPVKVEFANKGSAQPDAEEGGKDDKKRDAKYWHDKGLPKEIDPENGVDLGELNLDMLPEEMRKSFMESVSEEDYEKIFGTKKGDYEKESAERKKAEKTDEDDDEEGHTEL